MREWVWVEWGGGGLGLMMGTREWRLGAKRNSVIYCWSGGGWIQREVLRGIAIFLLWKKSFVLPSFVFIQNDTTFLLPIHESSLSPFFSITYLFLCVWVLSSSSLLWFREAIWGSELKDVMVSFEMGFLSELLLILSHAFVSSFPKTVIK